MLDNITLGQIASGILIAGTIIGGIVAVMSPFKRLNDLEASMKRVTSDTNMIMLSLLPILEHLADDKTGNFTKELKDTKDNLTKYVVERK